MSNFALVSVEKDHKVDLSEGKVTVGRGPFLKVTDKRVSRNHAVLEVSGSSLTIRPIHINPTFYQASGNVKFEPLERDETKELKNGDCVSFLPDDLVFKVEIKEAKDITAKISKAEHISEQNSTSKSGKVERPFRELDKKEKCADEDKNELLDDGKKDEMEDVPCPSSRKMVDEVDIDQEEEQSDDYDDMEFEEDVNETLEVPARTLNKKRVLPNWMTRNKGDDASDKPKRGKPTNRNAKKVVEYEKKDKEELVESPDVREDENLQHVDDEKEKSDGIKGEKEDNETEKEEAEVEGQEEDKKRKRDDDDEHEGSCKKKEKELPRCQYGSNCYRKNPVHFQEYSHNRQVSDDNGDESRDDLPECQYGEYCYRKNPQHRVQYRHTPQPKTRDRKAKRKAATSKIRDVDEYGPNDYDYEDSFIDDESESSAEPSGDDDSDWQPPDDDGDDDDVSELLTEARDFTQNKKMLKPT